MSWELAGLRAVVVIESNLHKGYIFNDNRDVIVTTKHPNYIHLKTLYYNVRMSYFWVVVTL